MSPDCEDCGKTFETFADRHQHDCSPSDNADSFKSDPAVQQLSILVADAENGDVSALHQAIAQYETTQAAAHDADNTNRYREVSRTYQKRLINSLDEATQANGWAFLEDFVEAYHPDTSDEFPHVTTILQNVTARYLIRTRLTGSVADIPVAALDYFDAILADVGEVQDYIREGLHPYGWGIGHPEHDVAATIHTLAKDDLFLANPMLEHAFYADQYAAIELFEQIAADDSIQETVPHGTGEISPVRALLDAPAGAASDAFWPTIPRYWDWHDDPSFDFELDAAVSQRLRILVKQEGLDADLPEDWTITDFTM